MEHYGSLTMRYRLVASVFRSARRVSAVLCMVAVAACDGDTTDPPTTGAVQVAVSTTGSDLDPDGYTVLLAGGSGQAVGVDGTVSFSDVEAGSRQITLDGVAANCSVTGDNPVTVTVVAGQTVQAAFAVTCTQILGDLEIVTATTGSDIDSDGFTYSIDGGSAQAIGANATATVQLAPGDYSIQLGGVAANCTVAGDNPRTVTVTASTTTTTTFDVSCTAIAGSLVVTTATTGTDLDPDGYSVSVDGGTGQAIGLNAVLTLNNVAGGDRTVELTGLANNCTVDPGDNPRTVTVPQTSAVQTDFAIICVPITGSVEVTTVTTGVDIDPDGYTVSVAGGTGQAIDVDGTITVSGVVHGDRTVQLANLQSNCSVVNGDNPRTVTVPGEGTVQTTFEVSCVALTGNLNVTASTTGSGLDPDGYTVSVDGGPGEALPTNGSFAFSDVETGDRSVLLTGIAANCSVTGDNPATVTVPPDGIAVHTFNITCAEVVGSVEVTTSTTGAQPDPDGYTLEVEGETPVPIGIDETVTVNDVAIGDRTVELTGLAANCSVSGEHPRTVTVTDGGTVSTTFDINCPLALSDKIVFDSDRDGDVDIYVMDPSGTGVQQLTNEAGRDAEPYVSRNGTRIVFVSSRDGNKDIYVMDANGGNQTPLTNDAADDTEPAFSQDGSKIVFSRGVGAASEVWVMDADGSNETQLTFEAGRDGLAQWSPDGTKIAFSSERDGDLAVWVMDADGDNPTKLADDTGLDFGPAFSPDGTKIVFTSERDGNRNIYVMNADGSSETPLTTDAADDLAPQWSPDGLQIVFASFRDDASDAEVYVMNANGTSQTNITSNAAHDFEASWSP
jgi:Tol biopolymer transport system component